MEIALTVPYRLTETLIRTAAQAGASVITVHGRTRHQSSAGTPVNLDAIKHAVEFAKPLSLPIVANGDIWSKADADRVRAVCGVRGVMSARGLLANPVCCSVIVLART